MTGPMRETLMKSLLRISLVVFVLPGILSAVTLRAYYLPIDSLNAQFGSQDIALRLKHDSLVVDIAGKQSTFLQTRRDTITRDDLTMNDFFESSLRCMDWGNDTLAVIYSFKPTVFQGDTLEFAARMQFFSKSKNYNIGPGRRYEGIRIAKKDLLGFYYGPPEVQIRRVFLGLVTGSIVILLLMVITGVY